MLAYFGVFRHFLAFFGVLRQIGDSRERVCGILRHFAAFCGILRHFAALCGIMRHYAARWR